MAAEGADGPRRFLIAVAVAEHTIAGSQWDRPGLWDAREQMVELFTTRFGYTLVESVGMNPTAIQLLDALDEFCRDSDRRPDDILAVYFTGHGERLDGLDRHVLMTAESDPDRLHRAVSTSEIADTLLYKTPICRLLLMLDTCYSGKGGAQFAQTALDSYTNRWAAKSGNGIVVLSSAQPRQLARAGRFPQLLTDSAGSLAAAGYSPPVIAIQAPTTQIAKSAGESGDQMLSFHEIALTDTAPPFLPNPRHHPRMTDVDLAIQRAREWEEHAERREVELRTRLMVRAMGNSQARGWWFCGRHTALTDITGWLTRPDPAYRLLAVTGDPGSGKTAVLGLIATLSHPEYRRTVPVQTLDLPAAAIPAVGALDVAIYAQNLTLDEIRDGIAAAAEISADTVGELAEALHERSTPLTVLIDGLDEATDPTEVTRNLLSPLLEHAYQGIRLLIGTRSYLLGNLGLDRNSALDLDSARYADRAALTIYALRGLVESAPDSIYRHQPQPTLRAVADAVAEQASPSFLVARIVSATLAAEPGLPDPADPVWRAGLPSLPGSAMHHDLQSRLRDNADKARELLRPLAFAQGQGLPWEDLWAPIASTIAAVTYTDHDLMWLRRSAGSYVVEATENGRSAYRLHHQALAEYLAHDHDPAVVHAAFVTALHQQVPVHTDGYRDWIRAHPYTLHHLATHAAHADMIDDLLTDTEYLVHAEPASLLAAVVHVRSKDALLTRAVYRCSAAYHRSLPPARRRQLLAIDAARFGAIDLQHKLNRLLHWQVRWATGAHTHTAHRATFIGHTKGVAALACTFLDNRPVAVTASRDDTTVRVWDLTTGTEHSELTGHTTPVRAVACTYLHDRPIAVTGGSDGTVRVWDLASGVEQFALAGHNDAVRAAACTLLHGRPVAVTGGGDGSVRVWDLSTGTELAILAGHTSGVEAVACMYLDDQAVAVTGSHRGTVRVWDLSTGTELAMLAGHTSGVEAVTCTYLDNRPVAI
ncbi:caspase family protein [Nocardia sp. NPDC003963]